ncbi:MAG: sugar transferase [Dysgonamonadaceae bacterium]|jgi:exopolysaccharide biosynthesis polyprenyl glycosylphosphotransferase|nr:sugar transferase [Dysgonamonadaceae bacterium]
MKNKTQLIRYLLADFVAAHLAWFMFNVLRYYLIAQYQGFTDIWLYLRFIHVVKGQIIIPFGWILLHYYSGYYNTLLNKSRLSEFFTTFLTCLIGSVSIFFIILLGNPYKSIQIYYEQIIYLFLFSFGFTYLFRFLITNHAARKIRLRQWTISALILGTGTKARQTRQMLECPSDSMAYTIQGFIEINDDEKNDSIFNSDVLGYISNLGEIINRQKTEELIVAIDSNNDDDLLHLLYSLYQYKLPIKLPLSQPQLLTGHIKIGAIAGVPLIDINGNNYPEGERNIKLTLDKIVSLFVLVVLSPVYVYLAFRVSRDSKGPVFIRQERIGYMGKPFNIIKFRTMCEDAEKKGPLLSSEIDDRVTPFGRLMRKYRLDELPQFWNVLKGDMSLVGPRPERKFYIEQIVKKAPYFYLLHNVRPGISSLGMVKFGYARSIEEMIERMQYDILYYENMSLMMDIKILIYSIKTVYTGKGI